MIERRGLGAIGPVGAIALGAMGFAGFYGGGDDEDGVRAIRRARLSKHFGPVSSSIGPAVNFSSPMPYTRRVPSIRTSGVGHS